MAEHTKLPWRAETECWIPWNGAIGILPADDDEDNAIAWTTSGSNEAANAAFIIRAVNNHDALVRALAKIEYASRKDSLTDNERLQSIRTVVCAALSQLNDPVGSAPGSGK